MGSNSTRDVVPYQKGRRDLIRLHPSRIGGTCEQAFCVAAKVVGDMVGSAAHRMGLGPQATFERIIKGLEKEDRQKLLCEWYRAPHRFKILSKLQKECKTLLGYALP
jgi:hypothetical protein